MRRKVIKFCVQNGWKVSNEDIGESLNFDDIKLFLEHEALTINRISVYEREHCFRVPSPKPAIPANPANLATPNSIPSVPTAPALAPAPAPAPATVTTPAPAPTAVPYTIPTFPSRCVPCVSHCIWCDCPDHSCRSECRLFIHAMKTGNVRINEYGRVVLSSTGAVLPPAFGHGGMKSIYDVVYPPCQIQIKS
jgi:hypothetical protein